jgi:hypothetical protein
MTTGKESGQCLHRENQLRRPTVACSQAWVAWRIVSTLLRRRHGKKITTSMARTALWAVAPSEFGRRCAASLTITRITDGQK